MFYYPPPSSASTCQQLVVDRDQMTLLRKNAYDGSKGISAAKSGDSKYALEIVAFLDANINAYNQLISTCSTLPPPPISYVEMPEDLTAFHDPGVGTVAQPVPVETNPYAPAQTTDDIYPTTKTDNVHYPGEQNSQQNLVNNNPSEVPGGSKNKKWIIIGVAGMLLIVGVVVVAKKLKK